ncbi:hypothetical protein FRX31_020795 [Thalictrum thalictroides]|uniref:Uncharacterized protein n=1 Tax=Thalictrum thalictroides TaxID=46969 RepID=A0A7J6VY46_THATH|nr:hypothetical protein FRX31_020795 [Thalictrum thalictroides]
MGGSEVFSSLEQHKEDTIQLVSDSVYVVDQKTELIIEELRQMRLGLIEKELQQHKEDTATQIQSLKSSIQAVEQKTDLILEELRQLHTATTLEDICIMILLPLGAWFYFQIVRHYREKMRPGTQ